MKNMRKRTIAFGALFILCCVGLFIFYQNKRDSIVLKEVADGYEITLYDRGHNIYFSQIMPTAPTIRELPRDIFEIRVSVGSPAAYVFFADTERAIVSQTYFNPRLIDDNYVAYMDDGTLIITDLFSEEGCCQKIVRDFTKTADPISAVINIEMLENGDVRLTYYEGVNYDEVTEIIPKDVPLESIRI